jgi:hypothetical protein
VIELLKYSGGEGYLDIYSGTADATPTASIDPYGDIETPTSLTVTAGTAPYGVSERWVATIPEAATAIEQAVTISWDWEQVGDERHRDVEYNIVSPYVHPVDACYRLGFSLDPQSVDYRNSDEIYAAERLARYAIESYTNGFFGNRVDTVEEIGQNTDVLVIGDFITHVHKIWENDTLVYHDGVLNTFGYPVVITDSQQSIRISAEMNLMEYSSEYTASNYTTQANYVRGYPTVRMPAFRQGWNYRIEGQFGFTSVPSEIKECAIMLVNDYLCNDAAWRRKYLTSIKTSDWSLEFGSETFKGTGNAIVDKILDGFSRYSMVVI